ncbi:MAG TPA: hypothetical protein VIV12_10070 [Streptosporangiaceae bacterium]
MRHPGAAGWHTADEPLDEADLALLAQIQDMFAAVDPMPAGLPERIQFSLALRDLEFEVARLSVEEDQPVLAARGAEQSRTITFDSDSLTIMIRIDSNQDGTARVDGWLAPAQPRTIDFRTAAGTLTAVADDRGRFSFTRVPRGQAQLLIRAEAGSAGSGQAVVTPALIL